jgi:hypothetical protein
MQACSHREIPEVLDEILQEAARNQKLPQAMVTTALKRDLSVVSSENAPDVARCFAMRLSLLREALVIIENRGGGSDHPEELHALFQTLTEEVLALPGVVREVRDPLGILRRLHKVPELRVVPEFVSAILGIRDERIGGDSERHSREQLSTAYGLGGFMYQPSEIVDLWPLFEHLSFATGSVFYDLGSGYGHALFYGAALRPDLSFRGIELMSARVEECQSVASRLGIGNVAFTTGDLSHGGFGDADIIFLFNPFPPDTQGEVRRHIADLAEAKPLVVLDYYGLVSREVVTVRALPLVKLAPYRLSVSRRFYKESRALVGLSGAGATPRW